MIIVIDLNSNRPFSVRVNQGAIVMFQIQI